MIFEVEVENHLGEKLVMELARPQKSGVIITDITGIGPGVADVMVNEYAVGDGGVYSSSRLPERNIVFYIQYVDEPSAEESRLRTYRYFPIKKPVKLTFTTEHNELSIDGYVESNDIDIFREDSGAQISIICPDPYFYDSVDKTTKFYGVEPMFEFIFENDSLTEPKLEFSELRVSREDTVFYQGQADTGVMFTVHIGSETSGLVLYHLTTRSMFKLKDDIIKNTTGKGLSPGDKVIINTERGRKYVVLLRDGVSHNILNAVERDSQWFSLIQGDNIFAFTAEEGEDSLQLDIKYRVKYSGL